MMSNDLSNSCNTHLQVLSHKQKFSTKSRTYLSGTVDLFDQTLPRDRTNTPRCNRHLSPLKLWLSKWGHLMSLPHLHCWIWSTSIPDTVCLFHRGKSGYEKQNRKKAIAQVLNVKWLQNVPRTTINSKANDYFRARANFRGWLSSPGNGWTKATPLNQGCWSSEIQRISTSSLAKEGPTCFSQHFLSWSSVKPLCLKEKFGLFVDFEFLTEMGSWGTD